MDAKDEEGDIKLQKESAELLAELERFLPTFLQKPDGHGGTRLRTRVRSWDTDRSIYRVGVRSSTTMRATTTS